MSLYNSRQRLSFNLLHSLNGDLFLLDTLNSLLQFSKLLFAFFSLEFQNTQMLLVFAFLLPLDTMLQHDFRKGFFFFLYP